MVMLANRLFEAFLTRRFVDKETQSELIGCMLAYWCLASQPQFDIRLYQAPERLLLLQKAQDIEHICRHN